MHKGRYVVRVQHYAKIQGIMTALKIRMVNRLEGEKQRGSYYLKTPTLILPHPSTCTPASSLTLLEYWLFQEVLSIVASPGGPSFFAPSSGQLLLPLSSHFLPLTEKQ